MYVPPPTPLLGQVLSNRWKLGAVVGRGACSDVYEVTDIRGAGRSTENGGAFVAKIAPLPQAAPHQPNDGKKRLTPPVACRAFHIENFLFGEVGSVDEENISLIDFGISSRWVHGAIASLQRTAAVPLWYLFELRGRIRNTRGNDLRAHKKYVHAAEARGDLASATLWPIVCFRRDVPPNIFVITLCCVHEV